MDDQATDHRADLVARLFALITARCEDGAEIAATGQGRGLPATRHRELARRLEDIGEEIATLGGAASALLYDVEEPSCCRRQGR